MIRSSGRNCNGYYGTPWSVSLLLKISHLIPHGHRVLSKRIVVFSYVRPSFINNIILLRSNTFVNRTAHWCNFVTELSMSCWYNEFVTVQDGGKFHATTGASSLVSLLLHEISHRMNIRCFLTGLISQEDAIYQLRWYMKNILKRIAYVETSQCVACGCCAKKCPRSAITVINGIYASVKKELCVGCGLCKSECPASVITMKERI